MKLEEAITYAIMSDGHGKTTDQIAAAINRNACMYVRTANRLPPRRSMPAFAVILPSLLKKQAGSA
jgi:hypothetical protein